jgi:hypothetical protein
MKCKHFFFWDTKLPKERQEQIQTWLNSLTDEEQGLLDDLLKDKREEIEFDCEESHSENLVNSPPNSI